jgi:hypothetical protein
VSPVEDLPVGGRVKAMVVTWRQVDHTVVEAILRIVQDALLVVLECEVFLFAYGRELLLGVIAIEVRQAIVVVVPGPGLVAEKCSQRVVDALDLLEVALVDLAEMQDLAIAWTYLKAK